LSVEGCRVKRVKRERTKPALGSLGLYFAFVSSLRENRLVSTHRNSPEVFSARAARSPSVLGRSVPSARRQPPVKQWVFDRDTPILARGFECSVGIGDRPFAVDPPHRGGAVVGKSTLVGRFRETAQPDSERETRLEAREGLLGAPDAATPNSATTA
jgi:hypothetical protein